MSRQKRRSGRGALMMLAGFLAVSGIIRVALGVDAAIARESQKTHETKVVAECAPSLALPLVEALQQRETRLSSQETAIAERMQALALAEKMVTAKTEELRQAEEKLAATLALADGAAESDIARLTTVYENMKPKDAAALFASMDPEFSAGFLGRMRPSAAAAILSGMSPDLAYSVSVLLAGRNASVPTE